MQVETNTTAQKKAKLTKADFATDQEVRWCPGCGDYSVLAAVQKLLPTLDIAHEKFVFISGIGCSSRFPYYMNTYGFHTIHGRAPAVATGVKLANPDLSVWLVTGDGDALSIGGNHLIHLLRRNPDINVLLFNNRIYGLTKGQYSPTSEVGKVTKSTPHGSADHPLNPLLLALGAEATFVARTLDVDAKHMTAVLERANAHRGAAFVEIYQNCNIFNDGTFKYMSERTVRADTQLQLVHGQPLIFGANRDKGICIKDFKPEVVHLESGDEDRTKELGIVTYDAENRALAMLISQFQHPDFPVPMGVLYASDRPTFDTVTTTKRQAAKDKKPPHTNADENLRELFSSGGTWEVL